MPRRNVHTNDLFTDVHRNIRHESQRVVTTLTALREEWGNETWYIPTGKCYPAIERMEEVFANTTMRINLFFFF